ncbi:hypothetical protein B0H13DRAFT_1880610 [Mycena leptocephala]|nr:hypothetical protein B0H13DRAFT_1880610 [Mycena leptocephala]
MYLECPPHDKINVHCTERHMSRLTLTCGVHFIGVIFFATFLGPTSDVGTSLLFMSSTYSLLIQSVEGVWWKPGLFHHKEPNLCVVICQGDVEVHRTRTKRGLAAQWENLSTISTDSDSSAISLQLFHESSLLGGGSCLGVVDISIVALLGMCTSGDNGKFERCRREGERQAGRHALCAPNEASRSRGVGT